MIIVKLQGGMGNQMFQYAAARSLSITYGVDLLLDHSHLERMNRSTNSFTSRKFELGIFNLPAKKMSQEVIEETFERFKIAGFFKFNEKPVSYDPSFKKIQAFTYLNGYFHSYRYFQHNLATLKEEFIFNKSGLEFDSKIITQINNCNSVAIHIRRGDYITQAEIHNLYTICSLGYYKKAMDIMVDKYKTVSFFIFSDDLVWAKQNLNYPRAPVNFVAENECGDWIDMYLMSSCKHNIIANSTFSWWAAWLNNNDNKTIITPKKWFQVKREGIKLIDLCPKGWTRL